jgi:hypothetical protein
MERQILVAAVAADFSLADIMEAQELLYAAIFVAQ